MVLALGALAACGGHDPSKDIVPPSAAGAPRFLMVALESELLRSGESPHGLGLLSLDSIMTAPAVPPLRAAGLGDGYRLHIAPR